MPGAVEHQLLRFKDAECSNNIVEGVALKCLKGFSCIDKKRREKPSGVHSVSHGVSRNFMSIANRYRIKVVFTAYCKLNMLTPYSGGNSRLFEKAEGSPRNMPGC